MDMTNAGTPQAGGQLSGDTARAAAIKRLKALEEAGLNRPAGPTTGPPR